MSIQFSDTTITITTLGSSFVIQTTPIACDLVLIAVTAVIIVGVLVGWVICDGIKRKHRELSVDLTETAPR